MGEKSGTLYYSNGVPVGELPAITLDRKANDYAPFTVLFETAFSGSFKLRKRDRCGTRKRFVPWGRERTPRKICGAVDESEHRRSQTPESTGGFPGWERRYV